MTQDRVILGGHKWNVYIPTEKWEEWGTIVSQARDKNFKMYPGQGGYGPVIPAWVSLNWGGQIIKMGDHPYRNGRLK